MLRLWLGEVEAGVTRTDHPKLQCNSRELQLRKASCDAPNFPGVTHHGTVL